MRAASAAVSTGTPSSRANIVRIRSGGRGRLPVWVVRMRSTLRFIGVLPAGILLHRAPRPAGKITRDMISYLDEARVRALLDWDALIAAMEAALTALSAGRVMQPVRTMLTIEESQRYLGIMPAVAEDAMGLKLVSFYPGNARRGLPTHLAIIVLCRTDTGEPLAVMDGRLITERRTAAVSAAVTRRLAAPDARVLALLGSGVQAQAHLEALGRVRRFDEVRVWSPTAEHAQRFAREHGATAT